MDNRQGLGIRRPARRTGVSANGMEYLIVGDGPRTVLIMQGGPGSVLPSGPLTGLMVADNRRYLAGGYRVCYPTRRRKMRPGHSVADMADDHAQFIREELGGRVDLVVGESYGGMIAFYLAARHPDVARFVVTVGTAATFRQEGKELDLNWARLRVEGHHTVAAALLLDTLVPGAHVSWFRRLAAPAMGTVFATMDVPADDLLVEAEAELAYDARDVLDQIRVPMLLVCGDADQYVPAEAVRQTAARVAGSTVILYPGYGHLRTLMSGRLSRDVLAWVARQEGSPDDTRRQDHS